MSLLDFKIDKTFLQSHTMSFRVPVGDPKTAFLQEDAKLEFENEFYYITRMKKTRVGAEKFWEVVASAEWYRLGERKYIGTFQLTAVRPVDGLIEILDALTLSGLNWQMGSVTSDLEYYSMEVSDATYLDIIYQWAKITGNEVTFDTKDRKVNMVSTIGANYGLSFRYNRNLQEISREVQPPLVTRLFPYGRNDLTISGINGEEYLEDFSFYTNQGLTLEQARELYTKDYSYRDDSFVDEASLYRSAQVQFARLSQPIIEYHAKVVDLSRITGYSEGKFNIGDFILVEDEPMDIAVLTRVSRYVRYPYEPHRNEVELTANPIQLPDPNLAQSREGPERWTLFHTHNKDTLRYVTTHRTVLHRLPLLAHSEAKWMVYYSLRATCESTGVMTLTFTNDFDGEPLWPDVVFDCVAGEEIDYIYGIASEDVASSTYQLVVRGESTDGSSFRIDPNNSHFWVWGLGFTRGQNPTYTNSIRYDSTGVLQKFTVPDDVSELLIECHGSAGAGNSSRGYGAYVAGKLQVIAGDTYDILIGSNSHVVTVSGQAVIYPDGGYARDSAAGDVRGTFGGGSTQFRPEGGDLLDAFIVAAGGGGHSDQGASRPSANSKGGAGGFFQGGDGWGLSPIQTPGVLRAGLGASQTAPGLCSEVGVPEADGDWPVRGCGGRGGDTTNSFAFGGGSGGGGWHGGAGAGTPTLFGGGSYAGDGGGGSSYSASPIYDLEFQDGENSEDGYMIISWPDPSFLDA